MADFYDHVKIYVKAGNGGNGCISFHREKYISHGGPDGGDGGNGGNIVLVIEKGKNTLLDFRNRKKYVAANGGDGMKSKFHGANAPDLIIPVPEGTVVKDAKTGKIIKDMSCCEPFVLCKGGRGGWGNRHFATPTRQAPRFAKTGREGEEREVLLAPMLGVVSVGEGKGFVAADIPGLIEGASEGLGLGFDFLRHVDRCRLLVHVVDISASEGRDPTDDLITINTELEKYSPDLASRPQIIAANKCDILDRELVDIAKFEKFCEGHGYDIVYISAATGEGIPELLRKVYDRLQTLPPVTVYEPEYEEEVVGELVPTDITARKEDGVWFIEGAWLRRLMEGVNLDDRESMNYFDRTLRQNGIYDKMRELGVADGDVVNLYDLEFDFVD